jgi:hypothetical protein
MLGKKSRIIELNDLVYKERHDVEKQAQVADDWMTNVFGLTSIHPGTSTGSLLFTRYNKDWETRRNICNAFVSPRISKTVGGYILQPGFVQPVQLLSNAQLQWILSISSKKVYQEMGR